MINSYRIKSFFKYLFFFRHVKGYGIHSPFVFNLVRNLFYDKSMYYQMTTIDSIRKKYITNKCVIEINDLGVGGDIEPYKYKSISYLCKNASMPVKYGELIFKMVARFKPKEILELGTSIGISTLYLALPDKRARVNTIEGCANTLKVAKTTFDELGLKNVIAHLGNFDDKLPLVLNSLNSLDFVFFDGNHRKEATLNYFNQCLKKINNETIFIFDDIHWSKEMSEAWRLICEDPRVVVSIDIYRLGIVFFRKECQKQHYVVRF
ncbi:MAG: class I SAM-dependent methyltransferase [Marinilabiliaceae bacterium]|nr:class I SAM-dependent methyltransferase [Marinilabiliaceae bacterium]